MDYYSDILVDPIEMDNVVEPNFLSSKATSPDQFRPCLFNLPNVKWSKITDINALAPLTKTNKKYWLDNRMIIDEMKLLIDTYVNLPPHCLAESLTNNTPLEKEIEKYYTELYDLVDILIVKTLNNPRGMGMVGGIKVFMDSDGNNHNIGNNHLVVRMAMYLTFYFVKNSIKANDPVVYSLSTTMVKKIKEFRSEKEKALTCFTENELERYYKKTRKLNRLYDKLVNGYADS